MDFKFNKQRVTGDKKEDDLEGAKVFTNNLMLKMFQMLLELEQNRIIGKSEETIRKIMMGYKDKIKEYIPVLKSEIEKIRQKGVAYIG